MCASLLFDFCNRYRQTEFAINADVYKRQLLASLFFLSTIAFFKLTTAIFQLDVVFVKPNVINYNVYPQ